MTLGFSVRASPPLANQRPTDQPYAQLSKMSLTLYLPLLTPIATLAIVLVAFICNNSRLTDFRGEFRTAIAHVRSSMNDMRDMLRAEIRAADSRELLRAEFGGLRTEVERNHRELLHRIAGIETRG